ncbi:HEX1 [Candida pseudojiufengensis]|uniref:HEX1 n=1 Tax=Candida pseudojiufengensis TaxID=497109 RepID=UPI002224FABC|nr:HEX1 [Candida pseudojiufengensis]KAI5964062.1 HEX1 [Candida pseudojiufengensis]
MLIFLIFLIGIYAQINVLPKPQVVSEYGKPLLVDLQNLYLTSDDNILNNALIRIKNRKVPRGSEQIGVFEFLPLQIKVLVNDFISDLKIGSDESYELRVNAIDGIGIRSETLWGALRALSTLQQLLVKINNSIFIKNSVIIKDSPRFRHRGLMIDSARNYLTIDSILEQIDIMELVKMNVLHWHLVDTQSWPLELDSYPQMSNDAFSIDEKYKISDLKFIFEYARERGVIVIPEIDIPGHARAGWRQVDEEIVICGDCFWKGLAVEPPPGQLDILNNKTYEVINNVFNEMKFIFNTIHVGHDELQKSCYPQEWFQNQTLSEMIQLYLNKVFPIFNTANIIMWDDIISQHNVNLPQNITLQVWHGFDVVKNLTNKGHQVIVSSADHLYLDCGHGGFLTNDKRYVEAPENDEFNSGQAGSWCGPYKTYQRIYSFNILKNLTKEQQSLVVGAEAVLWSEQVDSNVLTSSIWPRTAALAETLWSGYKVDGLKNFTPRIFKFREWLVDLNYKVPPLASKYCLLNPNACNYS